MRNRSARWVAAAALGAVTGIANAQAMRFVDTQARAGGDGLSWETAYQKLFDALDEAEDDPTIEQIWVASGVYTPDRGAGDRTDTFELLSDLEVYGGFAGGETRLDQRDTETNETVLSGDFNGDDLPGPLNNGENAFHVVDASGTDETTLLDGFTITGGNAIDAPGLPIGGGVIIDPGSPRISNCLFTANTADVGGALAAVEGEPVISDCDFIGNLAENGGALELAFIAEEGHIVTITGCSFIDNHAPYGSGGAVLSGGTPFDNELPQDVILIDCLFERNSARFGSAVYDVNGRNFTMINCTVAENVDLADTIGSGTIWRRQTAQHSVTPVNPALFLGCTFIRNSAGGGSGGALNIEQTDAFVIGCTFLGNEAPMGNGGAIRVGPDSVLGFPPTGNVDLVNCLFAGNSALRAGAVGLETATGGGFSTVTNCTFLGNSADEVSGGLAADVDVAVANTIFWNNDVAGLMDEPAQILVSPAGSLDLNFSLVEGLTGALGGMGNIGADPLFVDADGADGIQGSSDDDARLTERSPARDTGSLGLLPLDQFDLDGDGDVDELIPFDLGNNPRVVGESVDMGAFEFPAAAPACQGDVNGDGEVGFADLIALLAAWGPCSPRECPEDLDGSGEVGFADVLTLLASWGPCVTPVEPVKCGAPGAGDCFMPHPTPSCADAECCQNICEVDPYCCAVEWDALCARRAVATCAGGSPVNDHCADAIHLGETTIVAFSTLEATTDGPALPAGCLEFDLTMVKDIWYCYTASCTGTVTVSTCTTVSYDSRLAAYEGCACPPTKLVACNDNVIPGCGLSSEMTFFAEAGETYLIRVGGNDAGGAFDGGGVGSVSFTCEP